jgi:hypothetical protein
MDMDIKTRTHKELVNRLVDAETFEDVLDVVIRVTHDVKYENYYQWQGKRLKTDGLYVNMKTVDNVNKAHPLLRLFINVRSITRKMYGVFIDRENLNATATLYILESMSDVLRGNRNDRVGDNLKTDGTVRGAIKLLADINRVDELCNYVYKETNLRILNEIKQDKNNPNYKATKNENNAWEYERREYLFTDNEKQMALERRMNQEKNLKTKSPVAENRQYVSPAFAYVVEHYLPRLTRKQQEFCNALMTYGVHRSEWNRDDDLESGAIYDHDNNLLYNRTNVNGYIRRIKEVLEIFFEREGIVSFNNRGELTLNEGKARAMQELRQRYYESESAEEKMLILMDYMELVGIEELFDTSLDDMETFDIYDAMDFLEDNEDNIDKLFT